MANFGERWAAARTRLPKAAPGFASVIRNSQVQNGEVPAQHAPHIAAMDLFVVPTIGFIQLYVLVIVRLARRDLPDQCHEAPNGGMDRAANHRSLHAIWSAPFEPFWARMLVSPKPRSRCS
jgi:hypothetical protein